MRAYYVDNRQKILSKRTAAYVPAANGFRICQQCGGGFVAKRRDSFFCGSACYRKACGIARRVKCYQSIDGAKAGGCVDCGIKDLRVLDFDHVRGVKLFTIGRAARSSSAMRIEREIAKCVVRCANCHRIATYARRATRFANVS
jgi:hypothetical protein